MKTPQGSSCFARVKQLKQLNLKTRNFFKASMLGLGCAACSFVYFVPGEEAGPEVPASSQVLCAQVIGYTFSVYIT